MNRLEMAQDAVNKFIEDHGTWDGTPENLNDLEFIVEDKLLSCEEYDNICCLAEMILEGQNVEFKDR